MFSSKLWWKSTCFGFNVWKQNLALVLLKGVLAQCCPEDTTSVIWYYNGISVNRPHHNCSLLLLFHQKPLRSRHAVLHRPLALSEETKTNAANTLQGCGWGHLASHGAPAAIWLTGGAAAGLSGTAKLVFLFHKTLFYLKKNISKLNIYLR